MLDLMEHAFRAGHELALHDAIVLCHERKQCLPPWALAELARRSQVVGRGEKAKKRMGRHALPRTEQQQLLSDACCFEKVNECREQWTRKLRGEDAFSAASHELNLDKETIRKAYSRHKRRLGKRGYYISLLYCLPDFVGYLEHNEALLGW